LVVLLVLPAARLASAAGAALLARLAGAFAASASSAVVTFAGVFFATALAVAILAIDYSIV
jgi:hypothetical protein